jgi:hypothetical protein
MSVKLRDIAGRRVLELAADKLVNTESDATAIIGDALGHRADWVVVAVSGLSSDFFQLRSGLAGAIVQKFVNYGCRLAIIGDVSTHVAASTAFRDFVIEANRGKHLWFTPTVAEFEAKLHREDSK